jgi:hypothetical protein
MVWLIVRCQKNHFFSEIYAIRPLVEIENEKKSITS